MVLPSTCVKILADALELNWAVKSAQAAIQSSVLGSERMVESFLGGGS